MRTELGKRYRDVPTGLCGVACARTEFFGGYVQVRIERFIDGVIKASDLAEGRLELVEDDEHSDGGYA